MDLLAKNKLLSFIVDKATLLNVVGMFHEGWQCKVGGKKITSDLAADLQFWICSNPLQQHLQICYGLPASAFWDIDWEAIDAATSDFPALYRLWMAKHVSSFFRCGKMVPHWGFWTHQHWPFCNAEVEDKPHLFTCPAPSCLDQWQASLDGFCE